MHPTSYLYLQFTSRLQDQHFHFKTIKTKGGLFSALPFPHTKRGDVVDLKVHPLLPSSIIIII